jgi:hypothetical protein
VGLLDDAIRDHLQLKRAHGADEEEIRRLEHEALGPARATGEFAPATDAGGEAAAPAAGPTAGEEPAAAAERAAEPATPPTEEHEHAPEPPAAAAEPQPESEARSRLRRAEPEPEPWLDDPDEVPAGESLDHRAPARDEDVLEETPEFLQETPDHDRLWFEQKPPRGFDFDK